MTGSIEDGGLLDRIRAGDAEAFGSLIDLHQPVTALIAGFLVEPATAEAAVARTWRAVSDGVQRFNGPESVRAWILTLLVDELNRTNALDRSEGEAPAEPGRFLEPGDRWEGWWKGDLRTWEGFGDEESPPAMVRQAAIDAVGSLPMLQRLLILLRDVAGLSLDECAAIVGRTIEDQQTLLDWARTTVRLALEQQIDLLGQST
jgi:DNA-directed RNA polymerase specialized sigma24 family protein